MSARVRGNPDIFRVASIWALRGPWLPIEKGSSASKLSYPTLATPGSNGHHGSV